MIRLSKCSISDLEVRATSDVLKREYLGMGTDVVDFEQRLQDYIGGMRSVVCVNSGTAAIQVALEALNIGSGDSVLVPSLTYVATFQAISATGALPIPCEVNPDTLFIDINDARGRVRPCTKAIVPVHYASQAQGLCELRDFAGEFNLRVVEDAAQAFGCRHNSENVGSTGDIVCFSFDGIKNITCGEGGCIVTADEQVLENSRDIRLLGVRKDSERRAAGQRSWDFDVERQGYRYHMSNINAAIGLVQLSRINEFASRRQYIANKYVQLLSSVTEVSCVFSDYREIIPHLFVIKAQERDGLRAYLAEKGIETGIHYKPNHSLSRFALGYNLPLTESIYAELLSLPCHVDLKGTELTYIAEQIKAYYV